MTTDARQIVDVHCHVHGREFDDDREQVLQRAAAAGVSAVLAMGEGHDDNQRLLQVIESLAGAPPLSLLPCFGLHPDHAATELLEAVVEQIRASAGLLAAIGEVGLDYWVAKDPDARERQRHVLGVLAELAAEVDLPLSVHSRSAGHHTIDLLRSAGARRVCMHAFDGAAKHAVRAAEDLGYYFSIPPSVVRSPQKQKLVRRLPLSRLLLETDAPVLGPDREHRNEPANVIYVAEYIAETKTVSVADVIEATTANARALFDLPLA